TPRRSMGCAASADARGGVNSMAPLYSTSVRVEAPLERVFAHLADIPNHPRWSGEAEFGLQSLELLTPGPVRVGTRFRSVGRNAEQHESPVATASAPQPDG